MRFTCDWQNKMVVSKDGLLNLRADSQGQRRKATAYLQHLCAM